MPSQNLLGFMWGGGSLQISLLQSASLSLMNTLQLISEQDCLYLKTCGILIVYTGRLVEFCVCLHAAVITRSASCSVLHNMTLCVYSSCFSDIVVHYWYERKYAALRTVKCFVTYIQDTLITFNFCLNLMYSTLQLAMFILVIKKVSSTELSGRFISSPWDRLMRRC